MSSKGSRKRKQEYRFDDFDQEREERNSQSLQKKVTLRDLCAEDKAKIGELIKKLAEEKESKEKLVKDLKQKTRKYKKSIERIKEFSENVIKEQQVTEQKFWQSLELLKKYENQENQKNIQNQQIQTSPQQSPTRDVEVHKFKFESPSRYLIQNQKGESEKKLSEKKSDKQSEKRQDSSEYNKEDNRNELLRIKQEIEEITNSLKGLQFNQENVIDNKFDTFDNRIEQQNTNKKEPQQYYANANKLNYIESYNEPQSPSFSCERNHHIIFAQEFQKFESKTQRHKQDQKPKQVTKQLSSSSSSSESDEIELAKKLLSIKKLKMYEQQQLSSQQKSQQPSYPTSAKKLQNNYESQLQEEQLNRINQNLDKKLQNLIGTSQSYSLSFNLSQNQQEQTPVQQRIDVQRFRDTTSLNKIQATGNSSKLSTPEPQSQPKKMFQKLDQRMEQSNISQQQKDQEELDELIDSLNSRYKSQDYQLSKTQTSKSKSQKEPIYSQNLFEVIQFLDSQQMKSNESLQKGDDQSMSQSSQYQHLMDKYSRLAMEYEDF